MRFAVCDCSLFCSFFWFMGLFWYFKYDRIQGCLFGKLLVHLCIFNLITSQRTLKIYMTEIMSFFIFRFCDGMRGWIFPDVLHTYFCLLKVQQPQVSLLRYILENEIDNVITKNADIRSSQHYRKYENCNFLGERLCWIQRTICRWNKKIHKRKF